MKKQTFLLLSLASVAASIPAAQAGEFSSRFACTRAMSAARPNSYQNWNSDVIVVGIPHRQRIQLFTEDGSYLAVLSNGDCHARLQGLDRSDERYRDSICEEEVVLPVKDRFKILDVRWENLDDRKRLDREERDDGHEDSLVSYVSIDFESKSLSYPELLVALPASQPGYDSLGTELRFKPVVRASSDGPFNYSLDRGLKLDREILGGLESLSGKLIADIRRLGDDSSSTPWQLHFKKEKYRKVFETCARQCSDSPEYDRALEAFNDIPMPPLVGTPENAPAK